MEPSPRDYFLENRGSEFLSGQHTAPVSGVSADGRSSEQPHHHDDHVPEVPAAQSSKAASSNQLSESRAFDTAVEGPPGHGGGSLMASALEMPPEGRAADSLQAFMAQVLLLDSVD